MALDEKDPSGSPPSLDGQATDSQPDKERFQDEGLNGQAGRQRRTSIAKGQIKHNKLGWKRLTVRHPYLPSIPTLHWVLPWLLTNAR